MTFGTPNFGYFENTENAQNLTSLHHQSATQSTMWRPKFLFPELEIPEPEPAPDDAAPVGDNEQEEEEEAEDGEFKLEFESDDEWESEEDLKFDLPDDAQDNDKDKFLDRSARSHRSSSSLCSVGSISLEEALNDSQEFHADRGDLDFDMGDRWKTALRESLNQPIFLDFERRPRKEAIRKLGKKNGKKNNKRRHGLERRFSDSQLDVSTADC